MKNLKNLSTTNKNIVLIVLILAITGGTWYYFRTQETEEVLERRETINEQALREVEEMTAEGYVIEEIKSPSGENVIQVLVGSSESEIDITLNGEKFESIVNGYNWEFDIEENYLYYADSTGTIGRMNIETKTIKELYVFENFQNIHFKISERQIAYLNGDNVIGLIDIKTGEKLIEKTIEELDIPYTVIPSEVIIPAIQIEDLGQNSIVIEVHNNGEYKYYRLTLPHLDVSEPE